MRIVVHGQQAFGEAVLTKLLENGENIVAVCTAPDKEGRPVDPLKQLALDNDIPVHQPASWKTPEAAALMQSFDADVCMMAYVLLFVPSEVLNIPKYGSFQYHPSLLPMHRGPSSINWPIATGATQTGLTIFWPDDGLDEGPVLLQKTCSIGPDETLGDVYFNKLFPMGVDAMLESLELVKSGTAPKIVQDLSQGTYESWFGKNEAKLDWSLSAQEVYNVIRAANPQPSAWTTHDGNILKLFDSRLGNGSGNPGEVLRAEGNEIEIAAAEGSIVVTRVRADAGKISAEDYISKSGLEAGLILGT
ncbi:MAG: methionyl-tRNA formyltransferase [Acidiferrobacterales bacterium]|nr:methionyl-tRNA formyltransferase [Acidiferrobacterales bacterium]